MSFLVSDVLSEARTVYLNDTSAGVRYTDANILPHFKKAYQSLEDILMANSIPVSNEIDADQTIVAGAGPTFTLPTNFLFPVKLFEKGPGESDDFFVPMIEKVWDPNLVRNDRLTYWIWREEVIKFIGATVDRVVRLRYKKTFVGTVVVGTTVAVSNVRSYLSAETARLVAKYVSQDNDRAAELEKEVLIASATMLSAHVKKNQSIPVRRKPYSPWKASGIRRLPN